MASSFNQFNRVLLAPSRLRPGMLLNFYDTQDNPPTAKNDVIQNVNSTTIEKPWVTFMSKKHSVWLKWHSRKTVCMCMDKHIFFSHRKLFVMFLSFKSTCCEDLDLHKGNFSNFSLGKYDKIQITFGGKIFRNVNWFSRIPQSPRKIELKLKTAKHIAHCNKASLSYFSSALSRLRIGNCNEF